jgi:8-oxo-dGTP pyrophosphatase MutT (NUDIX family)
MEFDIEKIFKNRMPSMIGDYKKSAVMVLISNIDGKLNVLFEKRSENLKNQPGDICLPGGKIEDGESPLQAAIRETTEELNINPGEIDLFGPLDYFISPYNSIIYPFVAYINKNSFNPNKSEVESTFWVPLNFFMQQEEEIHYVNIEPSFNDDFPFDLINQGKNYKFSKGKLMQIFYKYEDKVIWGYTALIIFDLIKVLKENKF